MKIYKIFLFFAPLIVLLNACKKDKFSPPSIQTVSIEAHSPTSITIVGNIIDLGSERAEDYGFIYNNTPQVDENTGIKVSLGSQISKGQFSKRIDNLELTYNSYYGAGIWARAYFKDSKGTALGSLLNVDLPRPEANGVIPSLGMSGDIVKIRGKFYNATSANTNVSFENIKAKINSVSDSEIEVEVPSGINASHGTPVAIKVNVGGASVASLNSFVILANVKDFSPKTGPVGSALRFTGDNLPSYYYNSEIRVHLGNVALENYYNNSGNVPFTVEERSIVYVTVNGRKKALESEFKVTPPQVISTNVETIMPGQSILVNCSNVFPKYDESAGRPMIKLGKGSYQGISWNSDTQFYYAVPEDTPEGDHTLYLKIGPHEVQAPKKINVSAYAATSFSPTSGGPGKEIEILGNFLKGQGYYVSFGKARQYVEANSSNSLKAYVPPGVEGKVKISVEVPNKTLTLPGLFEIEAPTFASFSPLSGVPGTLITIKGTGFDPYIYNTKVKFGSISVIPISVSYDTIVVAVPSNVSAGAMKLTVTTYEKNIVHPTNFTLLNK